MTPKACRFLARSITKWSAPSARDLRQSCVNRRIMPVLQRFPKYGRRSESPAGDEMQSQMTKSQLIEKIAQLRELAKKDVKGMMEALAQVGYQELKKNGVFVVPGFAKFVVIKKAATKARKGVNPFNGEEMMFKAKPARKVVRAR